MTAAKQVQITQGTKEWHEWRRKGIGASDVAALFGKSPYKTKRDLFFEKAGLGEPEDEDRSYIFRKGHEAEAAIRKLFSKHTKIEISPACFEKENVYLCSLDGYQRGIAILEAKLVGKEVLSKAHTTGEIPEHHWIQVQSQLHGSDSDKVFWGGVAPKVQDGVVVEFGRDEKFIKCIRAEVEDFYGMLEKNIVPPMSSQDTLFLTDPNLLAMAKELSILNAEMKEMELAYAELEKQIKDAAIHSKVKCGSLTISQVERSGSIDWQKVPEVKALSEEYLEKFRKKSSLYKQIRFGKAE